MMMRIGWMSGVKGFPRRRAGCIKCCHCILPLNVFLLLLFVINPLGIITFFRHTVDDKNGSKRRRRKKEGKKLKCIHGSLESFLIMEIVSLVDRSRETELLLRFDRMIRVDKRRTISSRQLFRITKEKKKRRQFSFFRCRILSGVTKTRVRQLKI